MDKKRLERLERFIENLPDPEKNRAIIVVEDQLFSWKKILDELKKGGALSVKIEHKMEEKLK